ncbi:unnamed protein product [Calypogeia fissa]
MVDLFDGKDKEFNIVEVIRLIPSHIYKLPGIGAMTKMLVRDVGIKGFNIPKTPKEVPRDESEENKREGTSNPHQMGLPSLAVAAAQVVAQDLVAQEVVRGTPKGTPKRTSHKALEGPAIGEKGPARGRP